MQINFFGSFSKKNNSTKAPLVTDATKTLTGYLIEPCSIMRPSFKIERFASDASPQSYTYAYIGAFSRFYFVEDWEWADGLWLCHLKEDVLASFKTQIGNQTEYILRYDSTSDFNGKITDTAYPATTDIDKRITYASNVFSSSLSIGCYIVGIISGGSTSAVGAISYYAMTDLEFGALKAKLFSNDNLEIMGIIDSQGQAIVQDISQEVLKTMYNPYQYIASCMWFPFLASSIPSTTVVTSINIGWWTYNLSGRLLYAQTMEFGESVGITDHPQAATRGSYLNFSPYTKRTLIGRFGTVAIDNSLFESGDTIGIGYLVDLITGQCRTTIEVRHTTEQTTTINAIAERNFLLAVPIQIAQVGTDYLGTAVQAMKAVNDTISSAFLGGITGATTAAVSGIYNTLNSSMPQVETSGTNGSFLIPSTRTELIEQYFKIVDEDITHKGRPLCESRQLSTLSGFILCAEGDMDLNCFDSERTAIRNYLTTGLFME